MRVLESPRDFSTRNLVPDREIGVKTTERFFYEKIFTGNLLVAVDEIEMRAPEIA